MNKFAYEGEEDKSYGLAGMAISLSVWDRADMLKEISLDSPDADAISFLPEFFVYQNPRMSAKTVWNESVKQYQVMMGLIMGNILCRHLCLKGAAVSNALASDIYALVERDGIDECQLEEDEVNMIYKKTFNYLANLYSDRRISRAASTFAKDIRQRRTMTGAEVIEELQILHIG